MKLGFLRTDTLKFSFITISSTIINGLLGALFYILLARLIGPREFGLVIVAVTTLTMIADIADFGTNSALLKSVASKINDSVYIYKSIKLASVFKTTIWILLLAGSWFAPFAAANLFHQPSLTPFLMLVPIGVGGAMFLSLMTSLLQGLQNYKFWSGIQIGTNLLRLFLLWGLYYIKQLNGINSFLLFIIVPFVGVLICLLKLPIRKIAQAKVESAQVTNFFSFSSWVGLMITITAFSSRLDTFLNARFLEAAQVGVYAAASQLISVMPQVISALGVVAAPRFASFTNNGDAWNYFKKFMQLVGGLAIVGVVLLPVALLLIPLVLGSAYTQAQTPFAILFIAMILFLLSVPIHNAIIYYLHKPSFFVATSIINLCLMLLVGPMLIMRYGVVGTSMMVLMTMLFNLFVPLGFLLLKMRNGK
ncbi:hypothetical protein A2631_02770 [Candidatus Daviesbacteria bacterium RIFCSPHIGHO2_01_FULL_44_29]|uniref:Polysaccharide biosynthesis protein C-terminal domain-containing protein n=1 Tax=Candidatus Daviesbacteria bacterium RIFCSPHIGHO2_02_FULL_43_12 TaxID=1797776 RepID=A0A1F5KK44_9BACT|nr:MAG: hypothetical protein A2631_02770 [Candidatus Daviesbacteria bacterium RIFCSPHIGHO2_01_FULL_44_29]OGE40839.1 MAG: hypothetical protein A3E86_02580 [Candidatus Daviesbacteria bacterium RIFCSPHIGHO2_12_FULL_47_45]OGE41307.1 MAG: hypothetical protein A3D25_02165 [Candidatus Daviesbacteria bacterium RIFCSPHIGHO2_02_FULL_43_12]OGE69508.1 MAG: hypothetical protein A3B55_03905 [Candidatus Daviesbacteria bacterium RIFCSPLOWO2_01_FULL_43_15]